MRALCPVDSAFIDLNNDGLGKCSQCGGLFRVPLIPFQVTCEHEPKPVQGFYYWLGEQVEYAFCSQECKQEMEQRLEIS